MGIGDDLVSVAARLPGLLATYPDGSAADLQPFFDLVTITSSLTPTSMAADLGLPASWLGEIFALRPSRTSQRAARETEHARDASTVGNQSRRLAARMRAEGYSTLEARVHYPGGEQP